MDERQRGGGGGGTVMDEGDEADVAGAALPDGGGGVVGVAPAEHLRLVATTAPRQEASMQAPSAARSARENSCDRAYKYPLGQCGTVLTEPCIKTP